MSDYGHMAVRTRLGSLPVFFNPCPYRRNPVVAIVLGVALRPHDVAVRLTRRITRYAGDFSHRIGPVCKAHPAIYRSPAGEK